MIVTRRRLSRRTLLRGAGVSLGLPVLESMTPAFSSQSAGSAVRRLAITYVPNGMVMEQWTPVTGAVDMPATLEPLEPFRRRLTVLSGLRNGGPSYAVHAAASTKFLTTMPPRPATGGQVGAGVSMDQLIARQVGGDTRLRSLEISLESGQPGTCDIASSCVYTDTIAWAGDTTPLAMEHNPRAVFERLFGEADSTSPAVRAVRAGIERSLLDSVTGSAQTLRRQVGSRDGARVDEYLEAVREAERRIQVAERDTRADVVALERPMGVPRSFVAQARLMFDLQVLAFQSDLTRVITFMVGREFSGRAYPEVDAPDAHHPTSHHQQDPEKLARLARINRHHVAQFGYFLQRLEATADGDGPLLDRVLVLYGAGMSDGNAHSPDGIPVLLVGEAAGGEAGRHLQYPEGAPLANLHLALLRKFGVSVARFGDSSGMLPGI